MKKFINMLSIALSIVACIVIICTFLTSYQFMYISELFDSYLSVQVIVAITMAVWSIRFWMNERGNRRYLYTLFSLCITASLVAFMFGTIR
ncbi:MAG: hypothetical protein ACRCVJ_14355 [Clostridium sp.]|uniref:hypothetical protein n=1 Tax=Clostridium sp. TaxID=1506 RepID=UPI003F411206